jgi:hypothetical protein
MTTAGTQSFGKNRPRGRAFAAPPRRWKWIKSITWRAALLYGAAGFVIGYPIYIWVYATVTGGITHQGNLSIVDLKAMSSFEMDQQNGTTQDIPPRFRALDGKRVKLTGQMYQPYQSEGKISGFSLVYSISNCCFNGPPKIQHFVQARVVGPKSVDYTGDFVDVTGVLHVGVVRAEGRIESVYRIDVEGVE